MDTCLSQLLEIIGSGRRLQEMSVPKELAEVRLPFGIVRVRCFNWSAQDIHKIYAMRTTVKLLGVDTLGIAVYPETDYEVPVFIADITAMKKKVLGYINVTPLFTDKEYVHHYIEPFKNIHERYSRLSRYENIPEWMHGYHTNYTVYSMAGAEQLGTLQQCAADYLTLYMELFSASSPTADEEKRLHISRARQQYIRDIQEKDSARKMLGKIIGSKKADRIFKEVLV